MSATSATDVKVDDSVFFHNGDKQKIVCKSWRAESEPRALVFLSHGYAEHCHEPSYDTLARALVGIGCYVFSHDHVGHGMSEGRRAMVKSADVYVDDILKHVDTERAKFANKPVYLVGHSMRALARVVGFVLPGVPVGTLDENLLSRDPEALRRFKDDPAPLSRQRLCRMGGGHHPCSRHGSGTSGPGGVAFSHSARYRRQGL
ncbi:hypothetical protein HPB51_013255 [Rhipicephalus microplus]|uniref:Serine aminopeptidase S33 domain-containing protein n=1 Tax=Rhipicephalus microplus TaxID=6941 RepID=A0A9J6E9Y1_RHIMP|nr:hypothetical protein HPB51_013255 [Rhipicephalus microplus]